ncbi:MAG: inositol phosphorylceramide synthase [Actinobacteria bacterium]|nr:inositol phosphorylceramide synthase [Actinomycetota bacterium]
MNKPRRNQSRILAILSRSPRRTRVVFVALYLVIFIWSANRFGVPVDRIAVTAWILAAFAFANVGHPWRAQRDMLRDWSIFAGMLFAYEYSRGIADQLGRPVTFTLLRDIDRAIFFGVDPNVWMQQKLNISSTLAWYEYPLAVTYMTHFIFPPGVAVVLWWVSRTQWVRYVRRLTILFFLSVVTYVMLPAAPPWMAARDGYLEPVQRITARGWSKMGLHTVSKIFDRGAATSNPVAALPSLHAACALLVVAFFWKQMPRILRPVSLVLPAAMALCLVYFGEHWVIDVVLGWLYVGAAFWLASRYENRRVLRRG